MPRILHYASTVMTMNVLLLFSIQSDSAAVPTFYHRSPQLQVHSFHGALKPGREFNFLGKAFPDNTVRRGGSEKKLYVVPSDKNQWIADWGQRAQEREQQYKAHYSSGVEKLMAGNAGEAREALRLADTLADRREKGNVAVLLALTEDSIIKSETGLEASLPLANRKDVLAAGNLTLGLIKFDKWIAGEDVSHAAKPYLKAAIANGAEPNLPNLLLTEIAANDGDCATVDKQLVAGFGNLDETEETVRILLADVYFARGACFHDDAIADEAARGVSQTMTPLFVKATMDYKRSLAYLESSEPLVAYGVISMKQMNKPDQSRKQFEMAIRLDPRNDLAYYNLACYYALSGNYKSTIANLSKAVQLNSEHKKSAADDSDFDSIRSDNDFQQLLR